MLSSRNCDHSFSRNEITVVVREYIDYFLVIIINEIVLFICILVVCTLPIFCIVCTVLGFKHVTVLVQYNRYQQIVDVLSLQCASESIKVRPPFQLLLLAMQDQKLLTRTLSTVVYLVCCYIFQSSLMEKLNEAIGNQRTSSECTSRTNSVSDGPT